MLKTKVLITDIDNLTDARYFAAWMVDGLIFNFDPSSERYIDLDRIVEIVNWVEGPAYGLVLSKEHTLEQIFEAINRANIQIIITDEMNEEISKAFPQLDYYIMSENRISPVDTQKTSFLLIEEKESLVQALNEKETPGLFLRAVGEETTGFKAFDFYDDIIELLEED